MLFLQLISDNSSIQHQGLTLEFGTNRQTTYFIDEKQILIEYSKKLIVKKLADLSYNYDY